MSKVRTRFAPSPTGRMHVGNLRSALYEFLIAKHEGGDFMLRIEDTDQERFVEGAVDIIYRTLAETGLVHDEGPDKDGGYGPYVQSERMKTGIYMKYAKELVEKGFLTSSCCPAFVMYIKKSFPKLVDYISHNLSPAAEIAKYIKETDPTSKVIFIGPCTAKKAEFLQEEQKKYIDSVLTFEELQALFDSKDLDIYSLSEDVLDNASYYGRIFARSGGLSDAVKQALKEQGLAEFELKPVVCNGIEQCKMALLKVGKVDIGNFIEGMACTGGCIGGAGCLTHGEKNKDEVDKYGMEAYEKTISSAISMIKNIQE